jgi:hypothetical protein
MICLLSMTEDGETAEVMSVGREGMIGLPILLPTGDDCYSVHVQLRTEVIAGDRDHPTTTPARLSATGAGTARSPLSPPPSGAAAAGTWVGTRTHRR